MKSKEALRMLETRCRYFATDDLEIEETNDARNVIEQDLDELDKYKFFEEQFGIDFITFYKAITKGVWVKNIAGQIYHTYVGLHNLTISSGSLENDFCFITPNNEILLFCNLNIGWALEKKELENE